MFSQAGGGGGGHYFLKDTISCMFIFNIGQEIKNVHLNIDNYFWHK